jgi:hypothetical protein
MQLYLTSTARRKGSSSRKKASEIVSSDFTTDMSANRPEGIALTQG